MNFPIKIVCLEQGYKLSVIDVAGCQCHSDNIDDGLIKLSQLLADQLMLLSEYGEAIPQASTIELAQKLNNEPKVIWSLLNFDITPYLGKSHKINVTLPELLIKRIDNCVNQHPDYKTRSGFIARACYNELTKLKSNY